MLLNTAQSHKFDRSGRSGCHRRSVSCITSHDEITYLPIESVEEENDSSTTAVSTGEDGSTRGDGVSMAQLQRSLKAASSENTDGVVSNAAGSFGGKIKLSPGAPGPRRSLLSDMLNNSSSQNNNQLERNAHRRRMLKSMRRYSVDASEMNFDVLGLYPSGRGSPLKGIPSEGEETTTSGNGAPEFRDTPTVRYLRNPSHATIKTKLIAGTAIRRGASDNESTDYFGIEDRVW
ncbi:hypothetical protein BGX34_007889 [Mortierella sp. NVP85]|nr:hypothetical protein BGX34_007889 [Mortierella sp. NVP85]